MTGTARDDYPTLGWHAYHHDRTNLGDQLRAALNEIDRLREDCFTWEATVQRLGTKIDEDRRTIDRLTFLFQDATERLAVHHQATIRRSGALE